MENSSLIISIKEARKLLGKDAEGMSDDDLRRIIISMNKIADGILTNTSVPKDSKV